MQALAITQHDKPEDAPVYRPPEYTAAKILNAVIVGRGTEEGNPTVDIVFQDEKGQKHVAMITGALIEGLGSACAGVRQRTTGS